MLGTTNKGYYYRYYFLVIDLLRRNQKKKKAAKRCSGFSLAFYSPVTDPNCVRAICTVDRLAVLRIPQRPTQIQTRVSNITFQ